MNASIMNEFGDKMKEPISKFIRINTFDYQSDKVEFVGILIMQHN